MKKILFSFVILIVTSAYADSTIRLDDKYTLTKPDQRHDLELIVRQKKKLWIELAVDQKKYKGFIFPTGETKEPIYRFNTTINGKKESLMFQFKENDDDECNGLTIINQEYSAIFKPWPDEKYIPLQSCKD